ncbi:MAG: stage sporulation protein [Bacilli bacterium]|nr:stage sporulation protein [Bacilli bacterium]
MPTQAKKTLTLTQQQYQQLAKKHEPGRPIFINCVRAFLVGGLICLLGQGIQVFFKSVCHLSEDSASGATVAVLIFLSVLATGFGFFDTIAQWAGAGTAVPVTGFANSIASSAIEHKSEGYVLGVGGNMFKVAGSVIVFGVVAAFFIALIKTLLQMGG